MSFQVSRRMSRAVTIQERLSGHLLDGPLGTTANKENLK
jgi:riboflavin synthase alpha subunit